MRLSWASRVVLIVSGLAGLVYLRFAVIEPIRDWDASDLAINYSAATVLRNGGSIYDVEALRQAHERRIGPTDGLYQGLFLTYNNPPTTALLMWPLSFLTFPVAKVVFVVINNLAYLGGILVIIRSLRAPWTAVVVLVAIGTLALFYPIRQSFGLGQINGVLVGLMSIGLVAALRQRDGLAGVMIALAAGLKLSPIVLLGFFLAQRRWRAVLSAALTGAGLLLAMLVFVGVDSLRYFVTTILPAVSRGTAAFPNQSLLGAIYRFDVPRGMMQVMVAAGDYPGARLVWLVLAAIILITTFVLVVRLRSSTDEQTAVAYGTFGVAGLLAGSLAWEHYMLWLVIPLGALVIDWFKSHWLPGWLFGLLLGAMLLLIGLPIPVQAALYQTSGPIGTSLTTWGMLGLWGLMSVRVPIAKPLS
jgi:alpha-1,2-mannosyltransferase